MKKFIFISSLLAAFTLGVNAATVLTTTISKTTNATSISDVSLVNTLADGVSVDSATLSSLVDKNSAALGLLAASSAGTSITFLDPDINIGKGGSGTSWTATFSYSGVSGISEINSVTLDIGAFNSSGSWQTAGAPFAGDLEITISFTNATTGDVLETFSNTVTIVAKSGTESPTWKIVDVTGTNSVNLTNTSNVNVAVTLKNSSITEGTYFGLTSLTFAGTVIPEPSMFGLLAGTLALGLAGTRRRRRGNAKNF